MKKFSVFLLSLLIVLGAAWTFLQSDFAKRVARDFLTKTLQESGFSIEIGKMEGTFPLFIDMEKIKLSSDAFDISMDSLKLKLSLFGLLRKEILFTEIHAKKITWQQQSIHPATNHIANKGLPLAVKIKNFELLDVAIPNYGSADFKGSMRMGKRNRNFFLDIAAKRPNYPGAKARLLAHIGQGGLVRIKGFLKTSDLASLSIPFPCEASGSLQLNARGIWGKKFFGKASAAASVKNLHSPLEKMCDGTWNGSVHFQGRFGDEWTFSQFHLANHQISMDGEGVLDAGGKIQKGLANIKTEQLSANMKIEAIDSGGYHIHASGPGWTGKADVALPMDIPHFTLESNSMKWNGHLALRDRILIGETNLSIGNLHDLPFGLYGSLKAKMDWTKLDSSIQGVRIEGESIGVYWKELFSQNIAFQAELIDPFDQIRGDLRFNGKQVKWKTLFLNTLNLETTKKENAWLFDLFAEGEWKHPLKLQLNGNWNYGSSRFASSLQRAEGSFFNHPFLLSQPAHFECFEDRILLTDLNLAFSDASLDLRIDKENQRTDLDLFLKHFPLDILSLNPLDIAIKGKTDCTLSLREKGENLTGNLTASIEGLEAASLGETSTLSASGQFKGHFDQKRLDLKGDLNVRNTPLLQLDISVPLDLSISSLQANLIYDKKVKGRVSYNGKVEEFLDFCDLGMHRIEGTGICDLTLQGSLQAPDFQGSFDFKDGYYENYLTGMQLTNIQATGFVKKNQLHLTSLTALDRRKKGQFSGSGSIDLQPDAFFPFRFNMALSHLEAVQIDLVAAETEGKIEIKGNAKEALASGSLEVVQSDFQIPSHIPRFLPNLAVTYKNASKPIAPPPLPSEFHPYPLFLDLTVQAPDGIFIQGRGLNSEWKGNFHIVGTYTEPAAQGKLELIKGEFVFSGRSFKLIDGSLTFRGKEHEMPYLNLAGLMQVKDIAITARLKGPLNNPQITIQSVPPLPLSTIMAYLLFGQELSEINSFQALQLANSLASLAGAGPDVLENTRKSLGVDRLQVVSVPGGDGEVENTIALQVGKYVSEGILVSFTQGAEDAAGNISIEIELKHGLTIQLESEQRQEQGKFTLKWNHSY